MRPSVRDTAEFLKVLADEARLQMLWLLFHHQELCVCDLMSALEITQSKASRHLRTLRQAGLVTDRKEGLWSYYSLRPVEDALFRGQLEVLRAQLGSRPAATALLTKLEKRLDKKTRAACCDAGPCATPTRRPVKRTALALQAGGR